MNEHDSSAPSSPASSVSSGLSGVFSLETEHAPDPLEALEIEAERVEMPLADPYSRPPSRPFTPADAPYQQAPLVEPEPAEVEPAAAVAAAAVAVAEEEDAREPCDDEGRYRLPTEIERVKIDMMVDTLGNFENFLKCPTCIDWTGDRFGRVHLACGHTMCLCCFLTLISVTPSPTPCPSCRTNVAAPRTEMRLGATPQAASNTLVENHCRALEKLSDALTAEQREMVRALKREIVIADKSMRVYVLNNHNHVHVGKAKPPCWTQSDNWHVHDDCALITYDLAELAPAMPPNCSRLITEAPEPVTDTAWRAAVRHMNEIMLNDAVATVGQVPVFQTFFRNAVDRYVAETVAARAPRAPVVEMS